MTPILALGPAWLDPDSLIRTLGFVGLLVIVFVESGLLVGFFLPGDSLLFTGGLLIATGQLPVPLWLALLLVPLAAVLGDQCGYLIGRRLGPAVFKKQDARFFKPKYVEDAYAFFDKYGGRAVLLARFVPVVRTFVPVVAGVGRMDYKHFLAWNVAGGVLWGAGVTTLGYLLGGIAFVRDNIEVILILIVLVSVLPVAFEVLRARRRGRVGSDRSGAEAAGGSRGRGAHRA
ncbi:DedA family protein [Quadrisphaera granulorum]|uniref:DedA family protein n=1 Tax=Quadrisphaera granulorum TaxID=317664 RepID=UPI001B85FC54|nr:VTT domain-containing protein [Quadrisphaera granulorum]